MMATYSPRLISTSTPETAWISCVAHDIGLPEIVGADDDAVPLELLAESDRFLFCQPLPSDGSRFLSLLLRLGALLSTFTWASLRMVRITW